jgi:hypothetical protein
VSPRYARAAGFSDVALTALVRFTSVALVLEWAVRVWKRRKDRIMMAELPRWMMPSCHSLDFLLRRRLAAVVHGMVLLPSLSFLA